MRAVSNTIAWKPETFIVACTCACHVLAAQAWMCMWRARVARAPLQQEYDGSRADAHVSRSTELRPFNSVLVCNMQLACNSAARLLLACYSPATGLLPGNKLHALIRALPDSAGLW